MIVWRAPAPNPRSQANRIVFSQSDFSRGSLFGDSFALEGEVPVASCYDGVSCRDVIPNRDKVIVVVNPDVDRSNKRNLQKDTKVRVLGKQEVRGGSPLLVTLRGPTGGARFWPDTGPESADYGWSCRCLSVR